MLRDEPLAIDVHVVLLHLILRIVTPVLTVHGVEQIRGVQGWQCERVVFARMAMHVVMLHGCGLRVVVFLRLQQ